MATTVKSAAVRWLVAKFGNTSNTVCASKFYVPKKSWTGRSAWWLEIPLQAIEKPKSGEIDLLCEAAPALDASDSGLASTGTGFFLTEGGFLVTNEHVVRNAAQLRLVTSAGLISAKVVKVDAANDLALLKAEGRFASLAITPSRGVKLGGTVATVGFPNIGLQGFAPKLAKGEIASLSGAGDDARYFQIRSLRTATMQPA